MQAPKLNTAELVSSQDHHIAIINSPSDAEVVTSDSDEEEYLKNKLLEGDDIVVLNNYHRLVYVVIAPENANPDNLELLRNLGNKIYEQLKLAKIEVIGIIGYECAKELVRVLLEGLYLSSYQYCELKTEKSNYQLKEIILNINTLNDNECEALVNLYKSVYLCRDLVNRPANLLGATELSKIIQQSGESAGFETEVLGLEKIRSLKMGGLLAVNKGSISPPTFNHLTYKPAGAINKQPIILVGKGVVYDTGGLSLKPTEGSMDMMKCDMAGAAVVLSTIQACALNKIPVYLIGLIPATDNRPGQEAMAPGDVITMLNGKTVEVLNTDAEGRLILADALVYAQKFDPQLVIDLATLTGSAIRAIGNKAAVVMGNANKDQKSALINNGYNTHERLAELPFWDDYADEIKSDVADIKNIGGNQAGAITAGKFLEQFVDYPWLHMDIAGPAYINAADSYRGKYGTGYGVRLLYNYLNEFWRNEREQ